MLVKTSELTVAALDWAVAKCEGISLVLAPFTGAKNFVILGQNMKPTSSTFEPSKYWAQGGPIIEREKINTDFQFERWIAGSRMKANLGIFEGSTPLIAAMRCFVFSKLGDEVDVPKELVDN